MVAEVRAEAASWHSPAVPDFEVKIERGRKTGRGDTQTVLSERERRSAKAVSKITVVRKPNIGGWEVAEHQDESWTAG